MPWLLLLLGMDCAFILMLWLADIQALLALSSAIVLGTIILFSAVLTAVCLRENRRQKAFSGFSEYAGGLSGTAAAPALRSGRK